MIHSYLRSIGFYKLYQNEELYNILEDIVTHPDEQMTYKDSFYNDFAFFFKICRGKYGDFNLWKFYGCG